MASEQHIQILRQGVEVWNQWREDYPHIRPDLSFSDLSRLDLYLVNFERANLRGAGCYGCSFTDAVFFGADLRDAKFIDAELFLSNFRQAQCCNANFSGADLSLTNLMGANFDGSELSRADLFGAWVDHCSFNAAQAEETLFANVDLSLARGLETIVHAGPSTVGIDTMYASKGKIPVEFLRGCGVPESLISYIPSLVEAEGGIQFHSCFISFSHSDIEFVRKLHGKMRASHLRVWFAPEDIQAGKKIHEQIDRAIRMHDKLLVVLSNQSLRSEWVKTELRKAILAERRTGRRKLFPLRLVDMDTLQQWECFDADSGKDLGVEIREYFIPDFSSWRDETEFDSNFARLLKDLRSSDKS